MLALSSCRDCGLAVSASAKSCPRCGARKPAANRVERVSGGCLRAVLVVILILFLAWCASVCADVFLF